MTILKTLLDSAIIALPTLGALLLVLDQYGDKPMSKLAFRAMCLIYWGFIAWLLNRYSQENDWVFFFISLIVGIIATIVIYHMYKKSQNKKIVLP